MGTKLPLLQKSRKGRRFGWQLPKTTTMADIAPTRGSDVPSKVCPDSKLPEAPELSEIQTRNIRWLISESVKNLQAVGAEMERLNAKYNLHSCSKLVISGTEHLVEVVDKLSTTTVVFFRSERILKCKHLYGA